MIGDYPRFKATYTHDELVEHFLLSADECALVDSCRGEANRHGVAVLGDFRKSSYSVRPTVSPLLTPVA